MHDWSDRALCIGVDTSVFYPEQGGGTSSETKEAQRLCKKCPVRTECLMHALNLPESFGIWGGIPYRSRLKILRKYNSPVSYNQALEAIKSYDNIL
jgi:WhiB family transcriptional regulator, redox-sensing transcriptional regulator